MLRRILLLLTVAALMAAMLVATALPAFADPNPDRGPGECRPPGGVFSVTAKRPGSNNEPLPISEPGSTGGQIVKEVCAPGQLP